MIDLGYILQRARRVAWRHKTLWVFGFLASLGLAGLRLGVVSRNVWERAAQELPPDLARGVLDFLNSPWSTVAFVFIVLLVLAMSAGFMLLSSLARAAIVAQVQAAEERGSTGLRAGWEAGKLHAWPVLLLRLLLGIPTLLALLGGAVLALAWMLPALTGVRWPEGTLFAQVVPRLVASACLLPAIGLLLFASIPLGVLLRLAIPACVFEQRGVRESIRRAVETGRRHLGHTALLWLVQLIVTVVVAVVLGLPLALAAAALSVGALAVGFASLLWSIGLTFLIGLLVWLAAAAVRGVAEAYVSTMWTLAYREMHGLGLTGEAITLPQAGGEVERGWG